MTFAPLSCSSASLGRSGAGVEAGEEAAAAEVPSPPPYPAPEIELYMPKSGGRKLAKYIIRAWGVEPMPQHSSAWAHSTKGGREARRTRPRGPTSECSLLGKAFLKCEQGVQRPCTKVCKSRLDHDVHDGWAAQPKRPCAAERVRQLFQAREARYVERGKEGQVSKWCRRFSIIFVDKSSNENETEHVPD